MLCPSHDADTQSESQCASCIFQVPNRDSWSHICEGPGGTNRGDCFRLGSPQQPHAFQQAPLFWGGGAAYTLTWGIFLPFNTSFHPGGPRSIFWLEYTPQTSEGHLKRPSSWRVIVMDRMLIFREALGGERAGEGRETTAAQS